MCNQVSFADRVRDVAVNCASAYKSYFVDYEYLITSDAFTINPFYIVSAHEDNYLHLVGVSTSLSAEQFFDRCINNTLTCSDFSFSKIGKSESSVKGSVRRKIAALPYITNVFSTNSKIEEPYDKNSMQCSFASGNSVFTMGFTGQNRSKPMTLLRGNQLSQSLSKPLCLVLRKKKGDEKFSEIVLGDASDIKTKLDVLFGVLSEELIKQIA